MLQIFIQPSKISSSDWEIAYCKIKSITENFPTKLLRIESYNGYQRELDKKHFDLIVEENTPNEHISIWGDWVSFTGNQTVKFYKNWHKQLESKSYAKEVDSTKHISWFPNIPYKNDGDIPNANGVLPFGSPIIEPEGAHYKSALIAIGIMLENAFPNSVFLTFLRDADTEEMEAVMNWLENHFDESFAKPLYFDKIKLLQILKENYESDKELVCRLAHLYRKEHKSNIIFAIEHIGYQPTFDLYAEILADTGFGTFGFSDILNPWIASTESLENTLDFVTASKNYLLKNLSEKNQVEKAKKYDFGYILKMLLSNYILWTPLQREELAVFYTNKAELEGAETDLFGAINRMMGLRVDICPIYSTRDELFETFMFYDPKNGEKYKQIIDDWILKNSDKYAELKTQLEETLSKQENPTYLENEDENPKEEESLDKFLEKFQSHEKYFIKQALSSNPTFPETKKAVEAFKKRVVKGIENYPEREYLNLVRSLPKEINIDFIRKRIKEIGYCVNPEFEEWLEEIEEESEIFFHLHFALALKLYKRPEHYVRFRLLWNKDYWQSWND